MSVNPEFRRNLWLELSPYRLISMPVVLGAIFYLAYLTDDNRMAGRVSSASTSLFFLITMVWGTKLASESIMNEIRDHTWDGQRMSVITAWQLTWGKLFGSAIYPWYGALICMLCFGLSASAHDPGHTLKTMLVLLLSAVLAHAVSLLASLTAIRKERKFNKSQTAAMLILGIIVAGPFTNLALGRGMAVTWFAESYSQMDFLLFSVLAYAFWAVMGVYHMLRLELQMRNKPWAWFGFVLFIMLHGAGFVHGPPQVGRHALSAASPGFLAAYGISLAAIYVMAFAERKDFLSLQALVRLVSGGNWRRFPERAPRWLLTLPIALAAGGAVIVSAGSGNSGMAEVIAFVVVTLLFMSRDIGIMLFCNLGVTNRRADMLFVLYLVLLYGIFPTTLSAMQLNGATLAFWPRVDAYPFLGCVIVLLEVCALAFVVVMRWKKRSAE